MDADEEVVIPFPNVLETMGYFEEGGVSIAHSIITMYVQISMLPSSGSRTMPGPSVHDFH